MKKAVLTISIMQYGDGKLEEVRPNCCGVYARLECDGTVIDFGEHEDGSSPVPKDLLESLIEKLQGRSIEIKFDGVAECVR